MSELTENEKYLVNKIDQLERVIDLQQTSLNSYYEWHRKNKKHLKDLSVSEVPTLTKKRLV